MTIEYRKGEQTNTVLSLNGVERQKESGTDQSGDGGEV